MTEERNPQPGLSEAKLGIDARGGREQVNVQDQTDAT